VREAGLSEVVRQVRERIAARLAPFPEVYGLRRFGHRALLPPASADDIAFAERALGFPLPPLLRAVYTQIGNGGPALRLMGVGRDGQHGFDIFDGQDIVVAYLEGLEVVREEYRDWPERLVAIYDEYGCGVVSYLDCRAAPWPVLQWDAVDQPVLGVDCLSVEFPSLAEYLLRATAESYVRPFLNPGECRGI
jgi:hypothetical protein